MRPNIIRNASFNNCLKREAQLCVDEALDLVSVLPQNSLSYFSVTIVLKFTTDSINTEAVGAETMTREAHYLDFRYRISSQKDCVVTGSIIG